MTFGSGHYLRLAGVKEITDSGALKSCPLGVSALKVCPPQSLCTKILPEVILQPLIWLFKLINIQYNKFDLVL